MVNHRNHHDFGGTAFKGERVVMPVVDEGWWESLLSEEERYLVAGMGGRDNHENGRKGGDGNGSHSHDSARWHRTNEHAPQNQVDYLRSSADQTDWKFIEEKFANDETLTLEVSGYNRGGLLVDGEKVHGFLPISHLVDVSSELAVGPEDERDAVLSEFVGQVLEAKVIECDPERGRVVFSERAAQASAGRRNQLLNELQPGECVQGVITNLTDFGVFIDLGGVEGLVHISEISWGRVRHPEDLLSVGEQITAYVIQVDRERGRIALSLKRLCSNPWTTVDQRYKIGEVVDVTVTSLVSFGAFARIEEGLDGLIHISEMGEGSHHIVEEGQCIRARILHIDAERQRLGLSLNVE